MARFVSLDPVGRIRSRSPVISAKMLRHEFEGELSPSVCACQPAISRPSS